MLGPDVDLGLANDSMLESLFSEIRDMWKHPTTWSMLVVLLRAACRQVMQRLGHVSMPPLSSDTRIVANEGRPYSDLTYCEADLQGVHPADSVSGALWAMAGLISGPLENRPKNRCPYATEQAGQGGQGGDGWEEEEDIFSGDGRLTSCG